jgi:hypothetical protein
MKRRTNINIQNNSVQNDTPKKTSYIYTNDKKWYYRLKGEDGLIENISDEDRVFHLIISFINSEKRRFYTTFESYTDFVLYMLTLPVEKRCFHEVVIENRPQKMRFDMDVKRYKYFDDKIIEEIKKEDVQIFFEQLIEASVDEFEDMGFKLELQNILVFSSHGKEKWSYHIIIDGFYCDTHQDAGDLFKRIVSRMPKENIEWLDSSIYSVNHCLRVLGSVKEAQEELRVKILEKKWKYKNREILFEYPETPKHERHQLALEFERSFLTLNSTCYPLPSYLHKKSLDGIEETKKEKQAENEVLDYAMLLFQSLYGDICSYVSSMNNIIILERNYPSGCPICERVHEKDNAFLYLRPVESMCDVLFKYDIYFYCRRANGKKIKIGEKIIINENQISKDKVVVEKSSRVGFSLSDLEYVSKTPTYEFK